MARRQDSRGGEAIKQPIVYQNIKSLSVILLFRACILTACDSKSTKESSYIMNVKVISIEKCSATPLTISLVKDVAGEMGIAVSLEHIVVKTRDDAVAQRHIGSPTVQINDLDIDPGAREITQFGVT